MHIIIARHREKRKEGDDYGALAALVPMRLLISGTGPICEETQLQPPSDGNCKRQPEEEPTCRPPASRLNNAFITVLHCCSGVICSIYSKCNWNRGPSLFALYTLYIFNFKSCKCIFYLKSK